MTLEDIDNHHDNASENRRQTDSESGKAEGTRCEDVAVKTQDRDLKGSNSAREEHYRYVVCLKAP